MPHFFCAKCGQKIDADPSMTGISLPCPACRFQLTVPPLGTGADRLPPLSPSQQPAASSYQPAATPTPTPWQVESQQPPQPPTQQHSQRTRSRRASGNQRQLIIGTAIGILAFVGIFAGLNAWEKSRTASKSKPAPQPPAQAQTSPAPALAEPSAAPAPDIVSQKPATLPPAETPAEDGWITIEHHGLRLQLPGKTVVPEAPIDPKMAERLVDGVIDSRRTTLEETDIIISHSTYKPRYFKDARRLVSDNVSAFSELDSYKDVTMKRGETSISGRDAAYAQMSLTMLGKPYRHHIFYITHGHEVWEIFAIGPADTVSSVWSRIGDSLEFPAEPTTSADGWVTNEFHGLHVDLPGKVTPSASSGKRQDGKWHNSVLEGPKYVIDLVHRADPSVTEIDLPQMAQDLITQISKDMAATNLRSDKIETSISGRKAIYSELSYDSGGKPVIHHNLLIADGAGYWSLSIIGRPGSTAGEWTRIHESVRLATTTTPAPRPAAPPLADEKPAADGWVTNTFQGLQLHLPGKLTESGTSTPSNVAEGIVGGKWDLATLQSGSSRIHLSHAINKDGAELDLERMAGEIIRTNSRIGDVTDVRYKTTETTVSGFKAMIVDMSYTTGIGKGGLHALTISNGPEAWHFTIMGEAVETAASWELILPGVKFSTPPTLPALPPAIAKKPLPKGWAAKDFHGLSLHLPDGLSPSDEETSPNLAKQLEGKEDLQEVELRDSLITIIHRKYKPAFIPNFPRHRDSIIERITRRVDSPKVTRGETTFSGRDAVGYEITYVTDGEPLKNASGFLISQGAECWELNILGPDNEVAAITKQVRDSIQFKTPPPATSGAESADWTPTDFHGLQLHLPATLKPSETTPPPHIAKGLVDGQWHLSSFSVPKYVFHIAHGVHKDDGSRGMRDMMEAAITDTGRDDSISNIQLKRGETSIDGRKAATVEMTYRIKGDPHEHNSLLLSDGADVWVFSLLGDPGETSKAWKHILGSAKITGNTSASAPSPDKAPAGPVLTKFQGLRLELPSKLTETYKADPKSAPSMVGGKQWDGRIKGDSYMFAISHGTSRNPATIDQLLQQDPSLSLSDIPGVTQIKTQSQQFTISGRKAMMDETSYLIDGVPQIQYGMVALEGARIWVVTINGDPKDVKPIWKRIRETVSFDGATSALPAPGSTSTPAPWIATEFKGLKLKLPAAPKPEVSTVEDPHLVKGQSTFARVHQGGVSVGL